MASGKAFSGISRKWKTSYGMPKKIKKILLSEFPKIRMDHTWIQQLSDFPETSVLPLTLVLKVSKFFSNGKRPNI